MSKISKEGYEQIQVIKNALNSMYTKLNGTEELNKINDELEAIVGIVNEAGTWEEV
tara:strand:+ start:127 stop:294 length:168 start_codon:yes stop_codon:yes gene_type:complete